MTQITAQMVKDLREKTGAGMMDCKKALTETGDFEAAVTYLREKGLAAAAKKSGRIASEGTVSIFTDGNVATMVELNCETDFVARNPDFQALADKLSETVARSKGTVTAADGTTVDIEKLGTEKFSDGKIVSDVINEKIATIGEKITIRRAVSLNKGNSYGSYVHSGGSIGVLVSLMVEDASKISSDAISTLGKDLAMHIAAGNPQFLTRAEVDQATIENEKGIFRQQMIEMKKPENVLQKIIDGKLEKFFEEICLLEQKFVKDPDQSVTKVVDQAAKAAATTVKVLGYTRFKVGEGIEKKADDFAKEVAKMVGTN